MTACLSPNLRKITQGNVGLVYDSKTAKSLILREGALTVIDLLERGISLKEIRDTYDAPNLDKLVEALNQKRLLLLQNDDIPQPKYITPVDQVKNGRLLQHLRLNITEKCNLDCSYCFERVSNVYEKKRVMEWDVAKKAIDEFLSVISENKRESGTIRFFGGEPLLNWVLVKKSLEYIQEIKPAELNIGFILNTNGTLINDEIAQELKKHHVAVALSLDGVGASHDRTRKYINGKGSFDIIDEKMDILILNKCNFNLSVVCSDYNFPHLCELIDYVHKKSEENQYNINVNFNNIQICSRAELDTYPVEKKVEFLIDALKYAQQKGVVTYGGLTHFVFDKLTQGFVGSYCGGTGGEFSVDPEGNIFPCSGMDIKIGTVENFRDIFESEIYNELAARRAGEIENCKGCEIEAFCAGGCYAEVLSSSGKKSNSYRDCDLQRLTFRELVKQYILNR